MRDIYFVQNIDNSRLVRVTDPRRKRELRLMLSAVAMLFAMLFGYTWQKYQIVKLGYQVEDLRQKNSGLAEWNGALRLEEASLRDPIRIYAVAQQNLGLHSAQPGQIVRLQDAPVGDRSSVLADARALENAESR